MAIYNPPQTDKHKEKLSEIITLRAQLFRDSGKIVLKIGSIFSEVVAKKKAEATSKGLDSDTITLTPAERTEALAKVSLNVEQSFYRIEKKFREAMIKTGIYDVQNPIQATFLYPPMVQDEKEKSRGKQKENETDEPRALPASAFSTEGEKGLAAKS